MLFRSSDGCEAVVWRSVVMHEGIDDGIRSYWRDCDADHDALDAYRQLHDVVGEGAVGGSVVGRLFVWCTLPRIRQFIVGLCGDVIVVGGGRGGGRFVSSGDVRVDTALNWKEGYSGPCEGDLERAMLHGLCDDCVPDHLDASTCLHVWTLVERKRRELEMAGQYGLSVDQLRAVIGYTDYMYGPLNSTLRSFCDGAHGGRALELIRPFIWHLEAGLARLHGVAELSGVGCMVYRGMHSHISYPVGSVVCWRAFSSTSIESDVPIEVFGGSTGTLCMILSQRAVNVEPFSLHPEEKEVLFRCNSWFRVAFRFPVTLLRLLDCQSSVMILHEVIGGGYAFVWVVLEVGFVQAAR